MKLMPYVALALAAAPVIAEETRHVDSHEHGVGHLNIAIEGSQITMELTAPGADIVGFEYEAKSEEDLASVTAALSTLANPLDLFVFSNEAGCSVESATSELASEDDNHDEDHDDHDHEDDHAEHSEDEEHQDHDEETHDDHDDESSHTEFQAAYLLNCTNLGAVREITFAYFDKFANAQEVDVQIVSDQGATAVEVERSAPTLSLKELF